MSVSYQNINCIPTGIGVFKRTENDIICITANSYCCDILGFEDGELNGKSLNMILDCIHPDDLERCKYETISILDQNHKTNGNYRTINKKDIQFHWIHLEGQLVLGEDKNYYAYFTYTNVDALVNIQNSFEQNFKSLESFIQHIPGGVFAYSAEEDEKFLFVSDNMLNMLEYTREEFDAKFHSKFSNMVYHEDKERVLSEINAQISVGNYDVCSYRIEKKDGTLLWVHDEGNIITDTDGKRWFYVIIVNITASIQENNALEIRNNELRKIIDNIPVSIIVYKKVKNDIIVEATNGYIKSSSRGLSESMPKMTAKELDKLVYPDDRELVKNFFNMLFSDKAHSSELTYRTIFDIEKKDYIWYHCSAVRVDQEDGTSLLYTVYTDATYQKNKEADFNRLMQELLSSNPNSLCSFRLNLTKNLCSDEYGTSEYIRYFLNAKTADELLERFSSAIIDDDKAEEFKLNFNRTALIKSISNRNERLKFSYRRKTDNCHSIWVTTFFHIIQNPYTRDIEAFAYSINSDVEHKKEKIISSITDEEYDCIGLIDVSSKKIHYYYITGRPNMPDEIATFDYDESLSMISKFMHSEAEKEYYLRNVSLDNVIQNLEKKPVYIFSSSSCGYDGKTVRKQISFRYLEKNHSEIMFCLTDITDTFAHEEMYAEKLRKALASAESANQLKTDFLGNVSHDMRTPLNAIIGYSKLASQSDDKKEIYDYLNKIEISGNTLLSLINDTLDLQKIENGFIELKPQPIDSSLAIKEIIATVQPTMKAKNIDFTVDISHAEMVAINVDMVRLREIFINLLSNAAKFTPNGGKVELIIECLKRENNIAHDKIVIRDNGIGMSKDFQAKMFEPFSQERTKETAHINGSGLGLTIVKRLIELMNGRIEVESELGKGTSFIVYIDFERIEDYDKAKLPDDSDYSNITGVKVLICEDNLMNTEIAKKILEKNGAVVTTASDGLDGYNKFVCSQNGDFDIILMDIRMPVMDGNTAAVKIRNSNHPQAKTIPILAMSADAYENDVQKALKSGMNGHISKPINIEKLLSEIAINVNKKS